MAIIDTIGAAASGVIDAVASWHRNKYQCSAQSHEYLYVLLASWLLLSFAGVHVYRRLTKPMTERQKA